MKTNNRTLIVFLISCLVVSGCKKSSDDAPNSYVKFKLNNTWYTYTTNALGELGSDLADPSNTDLVILATSNDKKSTINFAVQVPGDLAPGKYTSNQFAGQLVFDYIIEEPGTFDAFSNDDADGLPPSTYTVTLSSATPNQLKGSFSGNYLYSFSKDSTIYLTEGEFQVRRIR